MATPVEVESEDHLHRLVQDHDTVIVSCIPNNQGGGSEEELHKELNSSVTSTVFCRTNMNTVRAAGLLLPDGREGDKDDDAKGHQEVWWLFFRGGEMVGKKACSVVRLNCSCSPSVSSSTRTATLFGFRRRGSRNALPDRVLRTRGVISFTRVNLDWSSFFALLML